MNVNVLQSYYLNTKNKKELIQFCQSANYLHCNKNELIFIIQKYYSYVIYEFVTLCYIRKRECYVTVLPISTCNICLQDNVFVIFACIVYHNYLMIHVHIVNDIITFHPQQMMITIKNVN